MVQQGARTRVAGSRGGLNIRGAHTGFTVPGGGSIAALPDFVHTKGTAFLLYPSGSTLRALSA